MLRRDSALLPPARQLGSQIRAGLLALALPLAALAIGAFSATRPQFAVGLVVAAAAGLLIAGDVRTLPPLLVVAVYAEGVSVGGFHVGRVVGLLALAAVAYYLLAGGRADLRLNPLVGIAGVLGFLILLSFYWAPDLGFAVAWFFRWALSLAFAIAFAVLVRTERHVHNVMVGFLGAAVAFGGLTLITYLGSGGSARSTGLVGDPNQFATYQAFAVPIALVFASREQLPHRRLAYYAAIVVVILSIVASYSRGGVVTLVVIVLATLFAPWRAFFRYPSQKAMYVVLLVAAAWTIAIVGSAAYQQRLATLLSGTDRGSGRTDLWAAAWNGYGHHPVLGLGAGGFEAESLDLLHSTPGVNIVASYVQAGRPVHNAYLEMLVDVGPAGLVLFLGIVVLTLAYLVRAARRFHASGDPMLERISSALIASLLGLSASMFFLSIELGHMLWIFIGLALALDRMSASLPGTSTGLRRFPRGSRRSAVPGPAGSV